MTQKSPGSSPLGERNKRIVRVLTATIEYQADRKETNMPPVVIMSQQAAGHHGTLQDGGGAIWSAAAFHLRLDRRHAFFPVAGTELVRLDGIEDAQRFRDAAAAAQTIG